MQGASVRSGVCVPICAVHFHPFRPSARSLYGRDRERFVSQMATLSARGNQGEYKARCSSARTIFDLTTSLGVSGSVRRWMAVHLSTCCTQYHGLHLQRGNEIQHDIECRHIRRQHLRRRQAWNIQPRGRVMEIQIPCGASSGSLFFAGVCMQLDVHDAPLSDKMDGLYGPHTFTPLVGRARAQRGGGIARKGPGGEGERAPC